MHTEPNYSLPWQRKRQYSSSSSGFVVSHGGRNWLLTNAHSVDYHTQARGQGGRREEGGGRREQGGGRREEGGRRGRGSTGTARRCIGKVTPPPSMTHTMSLPVHAHMHVCTHVPQPRSPPSSPTSPPPHPTPHLPRLQVKVKRRGDDRKFLARVISVGVDCDIAALQVDDPDFWAPQVRGGGAGGQGVEGGWRGVGGAWRGVEGEGGQRGGG